MARKYGGSFRNEPYESYNQQHDHGMMPYAPIYEVASAPQNGAYNAVYCYTCCRQGHMARDCRVQIPQQYPKYPQHGGYTQYLPQRGEYNPSCGHTLCFPRTTQ